MSRSMAQAVNEDTSPGCSGAASSSSFSSTGAGAQLRAICASRAMTVERTAISLPAYAASSQAVCSGSRTRTTASFTPSSTGASAAGAGAAVSSTGASSNRLNSSTVRGPRLSAASKASRASPAILLRISGELDPSALSKVNDAWAASASFRTTPLAIGASGSSTPRGDSCGSSSFESAHVWTVPTNEARHASVTAGTSSADVLMTSATRFMVRVLASASPDRAWANWAASISLVAREKGPLLTKRWRAFSQQRRGSEPAGALVSAVSRRPHDVCRSGVLASSPKATTARPRQRAATATASLSADSKAVARTVATPGPSNA
mmetsp:Transcript_11653/g.34349  ORF Transcript_11653/g.34349 Transcript_11653/m.34349 type:complete len:321 (-) Transcript_11653:1086-2048(-)